SRAVQRPAIHLAPNPGQRRRPIRHSERSRLARDRASEPVSPAGAAPAAGDAVACGSRLGRHGGAAQAVRRRLHRLFHRRGAAGHRGRLEWSSLRIVALVNASVDAIALGLILYAGGGVASGLGIVLVLPVLALTVLADRRDA